MPTMTDLGRVHATIAVKRAELATMFEDAEAAPANKRETLTRAIKTANGELSTLVDQAEAIKNAVQTDRLNRQPVGRQVIEDSDGDFWAGTHRSGPRPPGPRWGDAVLKANEQQGGDGMRGIKALLPSGTAVVEVPIGGPIENPRRARFLSELMPALDAPGGHLSYLRQTVRDNQASVVAEAALKPTSIYTLERIDDTTDVVAHLSESLPRSYFEDSEKIGQFIESEMRLGVNLAIDAKILADILAAGILTEGDIGSTLFTTRRSLTRLEEREVEPTCFVFHPRDWEQIELEMTAAWSANSNVPAPTDEVRRSLYGIPVVVSNALTENTGLLGDFRTSAALYRTGGIRLDWSEAASELFQYNLMQWRAEGRFQTAIYRPFAFIQINLAGTGS